MSSRKLALTEQFIQRFFRQRIAQKLLKHFWLRRRSIVGKNNLIFENFNCKLTKNFSVWRKRSHTACCEKLLGIPCHLQKWSEPELSSLTTSSQKLCRLNGVISEHFGNQQISRKSTYLHGTFQKTSLSSTQSVNWVN